MKWKNLVMKVKNALTVNGEPITALSGWNSFTGASASAGDLSEITYFTCLKTLSESIGKMPLALKQGFQVFAEVCQKISLIVFKFYIYSS